MSGKPLSVTAEHGDAAEDVNPEHDLFLGVHFLLSFRGNFLTGDYSNRFRPYWM
jgi:hypothetical protein